MSRKGVLRRVRIVCPTAQKGVLRLKAARNRKRAKKRRTILLGRKSFYSNAGRSTLRVRLATAGRRLVLRRKNVRAQATILSEIVATSGGNSRTLRIRAPRSRHKRR